MPNRQDEKAKGCGNEYKFFGVRPPVVSEFVLYGIAIPELTLALFGGLVGNWVLERHPLVLFIIVSVGGLLGFAVGVIKSRMYQRSLEAVAIGLLPPKCACHDEDVAET